jgi:hypothetical protein
MALADPADRGITRHLAGILGAEGEQGDARAATRRGSGGLAPGVAGADHDNIEHRAAFRRLAFHVKLFPEAEPPE